MGIEVQNARENYETQDSLVSQLQTLKEQASGVSLDEEALDLVKYQKQFDAAAKMIQVGDQMYDTILSLKRF